MKTKILLYLLMILTLAGGLVACDRMPVAGEAVTATPAVPLVRDNGGAVVVEGNVVPREDIRLYTRTGGKVSEVPVKKGDTVKKDAVLLKLVTYDDLEQAQAALAAAKLEQLNAQQALDKLNENGDVSTAQAQAAVATANKNLVDAQQSLADIDTDQYQTDLDTAQQDVGTAKSELDDAQKEWDKYKDMDPANQTRKTQKTTFDNAVKKYDDAVRKRDLLVNKLDQAKAMWKRPNPRWPMRSA